MRYQLWYVLLCAALFIIPSCTDNESDTSEFSNEIVTKEAGDKALKIPPIWIESIGVDACYRKQCTKYDFVIDLCNIHIPTTQIHVYAKPVNNSTWIYFGIANQVGNNDFLYELTTCVNVVYVPGIWEMRTQYSYIDPAALYDCNPTQNCGYCKAFTMPVPSGNCEVLNPDCLEGAAFESVPCTSISGLLSTYINENILECHPEFSPCGGGICFHPVEHHEASVVFDIDASGNVDLDAIMAALNAQIAADILDYFEPTGFPCSIDLQEIEVDCSGDQGFLIIEYRLVDLCHT